MSDFFSRRDFLRNACAPVVLSAMGAAACSDEASPVESAPAEAVQLDGDRIILDLTHEATRPLTEPGGALIIDKASTDIDEADTLAVNVEGAIHAYTAICTHQQGEIDLYEGGTFVCPRHGSRFDASGDVVRGPARKPLSEYQVEQHEDRVVITRT